MTETKLFKFDFIHKNIKYEISFSANVDENTAEELYINLLNCLSKSKYEPEAYLMVFDCFVYENKKVYQIGDFITNASVVFLPNSYMDWNKNTYYDLVKIPTIPSIYEVNKLNEEIGEIDYYFSIKSIGRWLNFFGDCTRDSYLVITKRIKTEIGYSYKTMTQFAELDFEERSFYSKFSFVSFSLLNEDDTIKVDWNFEKKYLEEDLKDETEFGKVVMPVEFPRIHEISVFTEYLEILKNIDKIDSLEKIKTFITTEKQKILYPTEMLLEE